MNEKTSKVLATLASRLLKNPEQATKAEVRRLAGCVLTQTEDLKAIQRVIKRRN